MAIEQRPSKVAARTFDWHEAHDRLARAEAQHKKQQTPSEEDVRRILRQRAIDLAVPLSEGTTKEHIDFVVIRLGEERYAIDAQQVTAAIATDGSTALPGLPAFYLGIISHRGAIYPLLDIRPLLGRKSISSLVPTTAIIVQSSGNAAAIAVDTIETLTRVDPASIARADEDAREHIAMTGIIAGSIVVIDIYRLLQDARLVVNDQPITRKRTDGGTLE